jgi:hypothetical protein
MVSSRDSHIIELWLQRQGSPRPEPVSRFLTL